MDYIGGFITKNPVLPTDSAASGVWRLNQALQYTKAGTWPVGGVYLINNSVRLRSSASAYFSKTFSGAGNLQTYTISFWAKRGVLSTTEYLFVGFSGSVSSQISFNSSDQLVLNVDGGNGYQITTSAVYRDPSAWYHIVAAVDTTQATAANRLKLYVNGVQVTALASSSYPTQNSNTYFFGAYGHWIGSSQGPSQYFDGYLTEFNAVNAQQLSPTSFGATDATTGVWNPIAYTGTYGTNGFYLNFKDATSTTTIGYDYSGNSNNWTANNISVTAGTTYDSMVDVPTNYGTDTAGTGATARGNYAVLNATQPTGATYSNGNLFCSGTVTCGGVSSLAMSSGKWYAEVVYASGSNANIVGIMNASVSDIANQDPSRASTGGVGYYALNGNKYIETTASAYGATYTTGDLIGIAVDMDNNTVEFFKNGTSQGVISTTINTTPKVFTSGNRSPASHSETWNFGQRPFTYQTPGTNRPEATFKALCTQNLTTPTISNGANYMAASLYTGTGASLTVSNAVNSISFQPDLVWMKSRSAATNHALYDSVRGVTKDIASNTTAVETTETTGLTAFGTTGFTIGALASINTNAATYVGWQWKGGGTAVTNTAGSITSSVSANTTAGFSVVTWTATGANATVGHGLGVSPSMIILKPRSQSDQWPTWINTFAVNEYVYVNLTNAKASLSTFMNGTLPSSSVVSLGTWSSVGTNNVTMVMYCFAAISGYSAFGSYTGNGSTDGPFAYLGFRPRYILIKRTDSTGSWYVWDTARSTYNQMTLALYPNLADAEPGGDDIDFLSNGFKMRDTFSYLNASGGTYIYAAFAENPFKIARAR